MHNKKESTLFWIYILLWAFKFFCNTFIYIKCLFWWLDIKSFIAQRKLSYHGISPQLLGGKKSNRCYLYHMCTHVSSRIFFFFFDVSSRFVRESYWILFLTHFIFLFSKLSYWVKFFLGGEFTSHLLPFALDSWFCLALCMSNFVPIDVIYYLILKTFFMYNFILQKLKI